MKIVSLFFLICISLFANGYQSVKAQKVFSNLDGVVWGMTFVNENEIIATLKQGELKRLTLHSKTQENITGVVPVLYQGQGGLLDIAKSPFFKKDKTLFFTYVKEIEGQGVTTLASAKLQGNTLIQWKDLLVSQSKSDTSRHFGSRITFDDKGHVYFTIGDRGVRPNSQNLNNHAGSVIRLNLDATVPKDNPFVAKQGLDEIYSYGHRNAQGLFFDAFTQQLFLVEHGPRGGDEINIVRKGANYGWPVISYGKEYWNPFPVGESTHKEGMEQPIKVYTPSIAPSNLIVYRGNQYPSLKNKILVGALKLRHINVIEINKKQQAVKETRLFTDLEERIRCLTISPKGFIYFSTDSGNIYKIVNH